MFYIKHRNRKILGAESFYDAVDKAAIMLKKQYVEQEAIEYRPEVGDGATISIGSDRFPATIVEVLENGKVRIQQDNYKLVSGTEQDGSAVYSYSPDKDGNKYLCYQDQRGNWKVWGDLNKHVALGSRRRYNDPHF